MNAIKNIIAVILSVLSSTAFADYSAKVSYVHDGDTISVTKPNNTKWKIRLSYIDAPEISPKPQPYAQASKKYLMSLVLNKTVVIKEKGQDQYGRTLAEVHLNKTNVNKLMVAQGYAWAYRFNPPMEYLNLERMAKNKKLGLWADSKPINPYDYRKSTK